MITHALPILALLAAPLDERSIQLTPCPVEGIEGGGLRGQLSVPEDRGGDAPSGDRHIDLGVLVLPSTTTDDGTRRALFVLQGGPGQAASELASFYAEILAPLRDRWDLVLLDQRGTGTSHPLRMQGPPEDILDEPGSLFPSSWVRASREALSQDADLDEYTTQAAVLDLEDVRAALGYGRIDLYGTSYGTRVALVYAHHFPERVRSMALKAVAPLELAVGAHYAEDAQAALDALWRDLEAHEQASASFPDLRRRFGEWLARLEREPARVQVQNPLTGEAQELVFGHDVAAAVVRSLLYAPSVASQLPVLMEQGMAGDLSAWGALAVRVRMTYATGLYGGMSLSVLAAEDGPRVAAREARAARTTDSFLGDLWVDGMMRALGGWPRGAMDAAFREPHPCDVPALLISGGADPALPPRWGERAAAQLPNSRHLVVPAGGHSFDSVVGCVDRWLVEFYRAGNAEGIDASCGQSIQRPPFVGLR